MRFIGLMKQGGSSTDPGGRTIYLRNILNMIPVHYALS
jgi:hypothetical protein